MSTKFYLPTSVKAVVMYLHPGIFRHFDSVLGEGNKSRADIMCLAFDTQKELDTFIACLHLQAKRHQILNMWHHIPSGSEKSLCQRLGTKMDYMHLIQWPDFTMDDLNHIEDVILSHTTCTISETIATKISLLASFRIKKLAEDMGLPINTSSTLLAISMVTHRFATIEDLIKFEILVETECLRCEISVKWSEIKNEFRDAYKAEMYALFKPVTPEHNRLDFWNREDFCIDKLKTILSILEKSPPTPKRYICDDSATRDKMKLLSQPRLLQICYEMGIMGVYHRKSAEELSEMLWTNPFASLGDVEKLIQLVEKKRVCQSIEQKWHVLLPENRHACLDRIGTALSCLAHEVPTAFWDASVPIEKLNEILIILDISPLKDMATRALPFLKMLESPNVKTLLLTGMLGGKAQSELAYCLVNIGEPLLQRAEAAVTEDESRGLDACMFKEMMRRQIDIVQKHIINALVFKTDENTQCDNHLFYINFAAAWITLREQHQVFVVEYLRSLPQIKAT